MLPQPRTSRAEALAAQQPAAAGDETPAGYAPTPDPAAQRQQRIDQLLAGVDRCYGALRAKDMARVAALYHPETKADREKLSKLGRILQTREWNAQIGEREDGEQRLDTSSPSMEFGFRLSWRDSFGGRLNSQPLFRAEFTETGGNLELASCRIVNSPKL